MDGKDPGEDAYPVAARWTIPFDRAGLTVTVTLREPSPDRWLLEVEQTRALRPRVVFRAGERPLDQECLHVARAIHAALSEFPDLRWGLDCDPDDGPSSPEPWASPNTA